MLSILNMTRYRRSRSGRRSHRYRSCGRELPFRPRRSRRSPWNESHLIFGRDHWISDQERVEKLARLCADGYSKQVMIAHDHCLKVHFAEHGGKGWVYTLTEVVPMLREAGVTEDQLNDIRVENPKRVFAV